MDRLRSEQPEPELETDRRAKWVKPEFSTLEAGSAEVGDIASPDGAINS